MICISMQNNNDKNTISNLANKIRIILSKDDEPDITLSLKMGFEENGFEIYTFNDPINALSNFKASLYDLYLHISPVLLSRLLYFVSG
jgi:hypothetical protein